jgi:SAM-dependent methyltransferase
MLKLPSAEGAESGLRYLDVGAGPGLITAAISHHFSVTHVVEPNPSVKFLENYHSHGWEVTPRAFQQVTFPDDTAFDFVLCSHMLYHVPIPEWSAFVQKAYKLLRPGGVLLLLLNGPRGPWHALMESLAKGSGGECMHSGHLLKAIEKAGLAAQTEVSAVTTSFKVPAGSASLAASFRSVVRTFTLSDVWTVDAYDALPAAERQRIEKRIDAFVDSQLTKSDGTLELNPMEDYIIIRRPA